MQVSKEFLMEAVGLSLLVGLLLIGVQMFERATNLMEALNREQEQQMKSMQEYEITQYENRTIDGVTAVNYIKNMVYHYGLKVLVDIGEMSFVIEEEEDCEKLKDAESEHYLNPFCLYSCMVIRDENGNAEHAYIKLKEGESDE